MQKFLYHVSPKENTESILEQGLIRKGFAVYCSEKPDSWWQPGLTIFKIDISNIKHEMTTFLPESDEILIWGNIQPEFISIYSEED